MRHRVKFVCAALLLSLSLIGLSSPRPAAEGPAWTSPESPDNGDGALLLRAE